MITIESAPEVEAAQAKFTPDGRGAFATSRLLNGQYAQANMQEWAEHGTIEGEPATIYWIFENSACISDDAGDYPWDQQLDRIVIDEA